MRARCWSASREIPRPLGCRRHRAVHGDAVRDGDRVMVAKLSPEKYRQIVELYPQMSGDDVAATVGCTKSAVYRILRRCGVSPRPAPIYKVPILERILKHSMPEPNSGCWLWLGSLSPDGYGQFNGADKIHGAHQASFIAHKGPIPAGLEINHKCRVRCCVNPDHLEAITHAENVKLSQRKPGPTKSHCVHGHQMAGHNLVHYKNNTVRCRECIRVDNLRRSAKRRAVLNV